MSKRDELFLFINSLAEENISCKYLLAENVQKILMHRNGSDVCVSSFLCALLTSKYVIKLI